MKFYIGSEDGSGIEYDNIGEFFGNLCGEIMKAQSRKQEYFTITIEDEPGKVQP